jgi:hypothetical protein
MEMKLSWEARLGIFLILLSFIIYGIKYLIIGDAENIFNYLFNSLGYLPLNVLLVTLILNRLLANRSKQNKLEKMNIVVGVFFSEVGTWLLTYLSDNDPNLCRLSGDLVKIDRWSDEEFIRVQDKFKNHNYSIDIKKIDVKALSTYLSSKRSFSVRLLENPLLLENESLYQSASGRIPPDRGTGAPPGLSRSSRSSRSAGFRLSASGRRH